MKNMILNKLKGGDRRSIGRVDEVVDEVMTDPRQFPDLFSGITSADPVVRMRASDAVEKITQRRPDLLQPFKQTMLNEIAQSEQQEVRWHAALMFSRLDMNGTERRQVYNTLMGYLHDKSSIVRTASMQGLVELALVDRSYCKEVVPVLRSMVKSGTPAMKARGRKLLKILKDAGCK